jgi:pilus assembly protein FimV
MYAQGAGAAAAVAGGVGAAGLAAAAVAGADLANDTGPQTMLSQQLEQAFRSRGDTAEIIEPDSTVDAVTGAPLDSGFDLDSLGLDRDATALPQFGDAEPQSAAKADAQADDNLLDFDLGGLSFEPVASTGTANAVHDDATAVPDLQFDMEPFAPLEPASGTPVVANRESLDDLAFDMNFDAPAQPAAPAVDEDDAFVLDLSKNGPNTDIDMAQLAREFDLSELPPLPEAPATPPPSDLKDPLFDLDAMDFGLLDANPATPVTPVGAKQEPVFDFGSTDLDLDPAPAAESATKSEDFTAAQAAKNPLFDLDMMDFGQPAAPAAPQDDPFAMNDVPAIPNPGTPVPRFDMTGLDLDLPVNDFTLTEPESPAGGAVDRDPLDRAPAELSAAQMEMETKLDLAIAYQEIGDKEGARELLDEVIKGGNVEQSSRASAMRSSLT